MHIDTILFDLDNTLYPVSSGIMQTLDTRIIEYVCRRLQITEEQALALRQEYLATYGTTLRGLHEHYGVEHEEYLAYVHDFATDAFIDSDAELDHLLGQIQARKAVLTNSPSEHAERVLRRLGIAQHFSHIFDIRFLAFQPKPHAAGYQRALDILNARGPHSALVEDTLRNLAPARALGMTTVFLTDHPDDAVREQADLIAPDILAALRQLLELEQGHAR
jgi:putative hydrolase of the HAD superfamily